MEVHILESKESQFSNILHSFSIKANCVSYKSIDNYFYYDIRLDPKAKIADIQKYANEISLAIKSPSKPNLKIIHNEGIIRLEFAGIRNKILKLTEYFDNNIPKYDIPCLLGQGIDGQKMWVDIAQMPHLLVSGTTGGGKSIILHNIIANLYNYNKVKLFLVDPKIVEFSKYENIKNDTQVVYSYEDTIFILDTLNEIMEERYRQFKDIKKLPYIILIIDEFADLIIQDQNDAFYNRLCRLAQKCRMAKIHIVLATQRPSSVFIRGELKANFPARIGCRTASGVDSRIIMDTNGCQNLIGNGDCLIRDNIHNLDRLQIAYTNAEEVVSLYGR